MSLKDQIFEAPLTKVPLDVDGWPDGLFVIEISGAEVQQRDEVLRLLGEDDYMLRVVTWIIACTVDADNNAVFTDVPDVITPKTLKEENDLTRLLKQPYDRLRKASDVVLTLNKMKPDSVDELKKSSEKTQTNNGGISSPDLSSTPST